MAIFLVTKFLNYAFSNFDLLIFWPIVGDHLRIRKSCIVLKFDLLIFWAIVGDHFGLGTVVLIFSLIGFCETHCTFVGFCETHCTSVLILFEYLPSRGFCFFFFISNERVFPR